MLDLRSATDKKWLDVVLADFDSFLVDHAACERKASATGMAFVSRYPNRKELILPMIEFAQEELEHFHRVYLKMAERGLTFAPDYKDEYVEALRNWARKGGTEGLVDSLLVAGVVEARGCERLKMVADALPASDPLSEMYLDLARAESRHHALFFRLAKLFADESHVRERASSLLDREVEIVRAMPIHPRVH
jgi:tRNA 2-(methylsulfanyl)-N6-isopentenyladenosine37 hydroxylase